MAKARVLRDLVLITDDVAFEEGEEVYAFWFDAEGVESVDDNNDLPEDCEGWSLHIQQIGEDGHRLKHPAEWDFDSISSDDVEIVDPSWQPITEGEQS